MQNQGNKGNSTTVDWRPEPAVVANIKTSPQLTANKVDIETFQKDGVVLLKNLLPEWVEPLRAGLQRNMDDAESYAFPCDSVGPNGK